MSWTFILSSNNKRHQSIIFSNNKNKGCIFVMFRHRGRPGQAQREPTQGAAIANRTLTGKSVSWRNRSWRLSWSCVGQQITLRREEARWFRACQDRSTETTVVELLHSCVVTDWCVEHRSDIMCGCGSSRLRGPSSETCKQRSSSCCTCLPPVVCVTDYTLPYATAQPTTAHLNIHNSTHGSGAIVELVEGWWGVMNLSLAMVLSLERPTVGGSTRAVAASGAIGSLCARDGCTCTM